MQRNAVFRVCRACHGTGRAAANHGARMRWLEIPRETYDAENWPHRFNASTAWLQQLIVDRLKRPLTAQLERRKKHA